MSKKNAKANPPTSLTIHLSEVGKFRGLKTTVKAPGFSITLNFMNSSHDAFNVNLTGGMLLPQDSRYQRLLVVGTETKIDGVYLRAMNVGHCVFVPPAAQDGTPSSVDVQLKTCCMDHPLAGPSGNEYRVGKEMAPDRLVKAAKTHCARVSLGKKMVPYEVNVKTVQSVCWDEETEDQRKQVDAAIASGKF